MTAIALPAAAQGRVELTGFGGWSFSEGVEVDRAESDGEAITGIDAPAGASFGAALDFWLNESVQLGGQFTSQSSSLDIEGTNPRELGSMRINNYHGVLTFHGGTMDSQTRPFFQFGLGATQLAPGELDGASIDNQPDSETKFSGTLGVGVKRYVSEKVAFRLAGRWTPTYIKSDPDGIYCSPYWSPWWGPSCVVLADTDYLNQMELTAGIVIRF